MFLSIVLIFFVASKNENCRQHFWLLLLFLSNCATAQQQTNFTHTTATLSEARSFLVATSLNELVLLGVDTIQEDRQVIVSISTMCQVVYGLRPVSLFLVGGLQLLPQTILSSLLEV